MQFATRVDLFFILANPPLRRLICQTIFPNYEDKKIRRYEIHRYA
jgi:hypothetical protein